MAFRLMIMLVLACSTFAPAALAQTPPSAAERAAYQGLHAAAAQGDADAIRRLAGSDDQIDRQDANGRTPLHIAAFARKPAAVAALLAAKADPDRLDHQRYDAVTIAAVQDDVATLEALLAGGASAGLVTSPYDGTALIAAAHLGHDGVVRELTAPVLPSTT